MHQDTNNFSNLLAIDNDGQLKVYLELESHGNIEYRMRLNGHLILDSTTVLYLNLLAPISLKCNIVNLPNEHGALHIKNFSVNGLEVLPRYLEHATFSTTWLNTLGIHELVIPKPFYPWYHEVSGQGWVA